MKNLWKASGIAVAAALLTRFVLLVWHNAVNLPIWDDFDSALFFANRLQDATSPLQKLQLILEQHNEHRIIINRLLTVLSLHLLGSVNFNFLIYCAATFLLALTLLLCRGTRTPSLTLIVAASVMLQPQYGDGLNWVTTCLASFSLCFLALACSHLALRPMPGFLWMIPLLALAGFSQGNGILLPFSIALMLITQRLWSRAAAVVLAGVAIIVLYFQGYNFPSQSRNLGELLTNYPKILEYGFTLIGASLGFSDQLSSVVLGVGVTALFFGALFTPALKRHPALFSFMLFLFLSAAINTAARGLSGAHWALSPGRYTILSSGIVAALAIVLFESATRRAARAVIIALAICFNLYSYDRYQHTVEDLHIRAVNDFSIYLLFHQGLTYPWPDRGVPIFDESLRRGVFSLDSVVNGLHLGDRATVKHADYRSVKSELRTHIDRVQAGSDFIVIEGWAFVRECKTASTTTYLRLFNDAHEVVIHPRIKARSDLADQLENPDRKQSGYVTMFPKSYLTSSEPYQFELLLECARGRFRQPTQYRIGLSGIEKVERRSAGKQN